MGLIWSGRKPQNIKILNQDHIFSARSEWGDTDFFFFFFFCFSCKWKILFIEWERHKVRKVILKKFTIMLCLYVYNVLPPQRLPGSFEDLLCNGQRKIKETRFKKKKKKVQKKETETKVVWTCLKVFLVSKDNSAGHSARKRKEEKVDRRGCGEIILRSGQGWTLLA